MGRGPARGLKIFESRRGGVVAPGRVVQHKKLALFGAIVVIIAIVLILFIRNDRQSVSDVIPEENK